MAILCRRLYYKYLKCLISVVLVAFFVQIILALNFFPTDSDNELKGRGSFKTNDIGDVSARKSNAGYEDDEDLSMKAHNNLKQTSLLRLEELDFRPACEITGREAISAIHRAKTQACKKLIANRTCQIQSGSFYPKGLPNYCAMKGVSYGTHLGCYQDEKKLRLLSSFYGNYANTNIPSACLDICVQAGFPYAGVQYASECFCGENKPNIAAKVDETLCGMPCPADVNQKCGGYFTMNVYETGLSKFEPQVPKVSSGQSASSVRIVFLLTLNGRALRQVHRLINALYRTSHYFYIHIDSRQDYLHRELDTLQKQFPNVKLASTRFSTIWGGASLLQMLLASMKDLFALGWKWDFVINLSESDFPIKSLETLERFLSANKGLNFVKSHGREVQRFIKKQGLDKTFIECETHMWRIGERKLPKGLVMDGGSDWIALSPEFVSYVIGEPDQLLTGLDVIFRHTLLPAESFFHTALRNSNFCNTYVDNNLHVTNWKRKLGCKCQYKHVVDWCGCSPNDFRTEDWPRIQNTQDRQLFFARKFEPIINQEIITRVEESIGFQDHNSITNLEAYWQSIYNTNDLTAKTDDTILTHANSIVRHNSKLLSEEECFIQVGEILEINTYSYADIYNGNLILHKVVINDNVEALLETWYKPKSHIIKNEDNEFADSIKIFKVSSDYDQKETTFRNFGNILGPLSEPILLYQFLPLLDKKPDNFTVLWLDPSGLIADLTNIQVDSNNLTNFIKPDLKLPLLPGVWKVGLSDASRLIVHTKFLITPLEYFSGKEVGPQEVNIIHSGSTNSYKKFTNTNVHNFIPSQEETVLMQKIALSHMKRVQQDLLEWIDSLNYNFYNILESCVNSVNKLTNNSCGKHKFKDCSLVKWSSLSPDPKGQMGILNEETGLLQRV